MIKFRIWLAKRLRRIADLLDDGLPVYFGGTFTPLYKTKEDDR